MNLSINTKEKSYDIYVNNHINNHFYNHITEINSGQKFIVCYPERLDAYVSSIISTLKANKINVKKMIIKDGEKSKNFVHINELVETLVRMQCNKDTFLISIGGGTTGDIIGFLASIYMRGINYINIPTTLLAMVDSSVGGKTGVNVANVKNVIGTFHQPHSIFMGINFLETLNAKHIRSGIGEIIKYGFIDSKKLLNDLCDNYDCIIQLKDKQLIKKLIIKSCKIKKKFVEKDVKDNYYRNILNFGHTFGHIIEAKYQSKQITHGEAILNGMYLSVKLSYLKGYMTQKTYSSILEKFKRLNIEYTFRLDFDDLKLINTDKKSTSTKIRFILLEDIAKPIIVDSIKLADLKEVVNI